MSSTPHLNGSDFASQHMYVQIVTCMKFPTVAYCTILSISTLSGGDDTSWKV